MILVCEEKMFMSKENKSDTMKGKSDEGGGKIITPFSNQKTMKKLVEV